MSCARAIAFYLSRVSFVGAIVWGGILLCLHNSIWIRDRKDFARQLIRCNISYLIAHMIQIKFLLQCCCTQCNGGACWHACCTANGLSIIPSRYWLPLFVHFTNSWFCKIRLFCGLQVCVLFLCTRGLLFLQNSLF